MSLLAQSHQAKAKLFTFTIYDKVTSNSLEGLRAIF
jgi:hypothetical protein